MQRTLEEIMLRQHKIQGRTIEDIEREIMLQSEAEKIKKIETQLSTKIVKVDYLKNSANIIFPDDVIDAIELNNRRIEWIEDKNKKPSRRGTRPVYIKYVFNMHKGLDKDGETYMLRYNIFNIDVGLYSTDYYNNPVDACMAMIEKLHDLNLL